MRNGIYMAEFGTGGIRHLAICSVKDGTIIGADVTHFITGEFVRKGHRFRGHLTLTRHSHRPDLREIAYLDRIESPFSGVGGDSFGEFQAEVVGRQGLRIHVSFHWLSGV
ncbi:hypothetical protein FHS83_000960 [Rhizomicrobium palustre]|uniref:Uncharacterized protein n=1 Tax=Rhizomicrobium palustre TaxID=189966 RepID=A0A846MX56_9PROT|nr:hypothetical protein [Rhizomicrobium palustre]NIK87642.1 hypothetical protein [Rhizomicrobium palustre]